MEVDFITRSKCRPIDQDNALCMEFREEGSSADVRDSSKIVLFKCIGFLINYLMYFVLFSLIVIKISITILFLGGPIITKYDEVQYFATGLLSFKYDSLTKNGKIVYGIMDLKQHEDFITDN